MMMNGRALAGVGRGAAHGAAATVAMTASMLLAKRLGLMGRTPPSKLTARMMRRLGVPPVTPLHEVATTAGHFGYGAGLGALFAVLQPRLPGPPAVHGALFGAVVWAASYAGWIPAVGLMPPPHRDRPGRQLSMLVSHLIFGGVLGALAPGRPTE
jgi:hypothetical protein